MRLLLYTAMLATALSAQNGAMPDDTRGSAKLSEDLRVDFSSARAVRGEDEELDVIVQWSDDAPAQGRSLAFLASRQDFDGVGLSTMRLKRSELAELAADPSVSYISADREVGATHFPPWMLKEAIGYRFAAMTTPERPVQTGQGIGIAIIDSGISADSYLRSGSNCATSRVAYSQNFVAGETTTNDVYGHGTHVAGIAAGTGLCLPGAYVDFSGIAREAKIINLRALNSRGVGTDSAVIAAIDRAIQLKSTYNIRVMNLSLGRTIRESFTLDPLCKAVERAWKAGIVVVVAAGNNGRDNSMNTKGYSTITSPANDPYVITVGATRMVGHTGREDDTVTSYSSKGPTLRDRIVKPDLVAPGNVVYARMDPSAYLVQSFQSNKVGVSMGMGPTIDNIFLLSGTSMAAPVVAGSVALLLQKDSSLKPDEVKARLMKTAWKPFVATAGINDRVTGEAFQLQNS